MSMFHELMMRKKEQIMYATIKGSLTENDGVFSGFSDNNYLEMQQAIPNLDVNSFLEIELKVTMPETITRQQIVGTNNANYTNNSTYDIGFQVYDDNRLWAHIYNSTSETRNAIYLTAPSALNGKVCYIKYTIANSRMTISLSFDKITWVSNYYDLPTTFSYTKASRSVLGWGNGSSAFAGSIDLSNSYIKLGSTKYNLQAVVGYTIVGSPTITDGVVSGFSSSDYLQLPNFPTLDNNSKVEIYIESKFYDNSVNYAVLSAYNGDTYDIKIMLDAGKRLYGYVYNNANSTRYFARLWCSELTPTSLLYTKYTIQNNLLKLARKIDLLNWFETEVSLTENFSYTKSTPLCIGRSLNGEIYIKNTYIKINNKLWFNGQQA